MRRKTPPSRTASDTDTRAPATSPRSDRWSSERLRQFGYDVGSVALVAHLAAVMLAGLVTLLADAGSFLGALAVAETIVGAVAFIVSPGGARLVNASERRKRAAGVVGAGMGKPVEGAPLLVCVLAGASCLAVGTALQLAGY